MDDRARNSCGGRIACYAVAALLMTALTAAQAIAAEVKVAVAANFTEPAREIGQLFEAASGHKLVLSFGSTGQFYAQITQGAPFEILLAADTATPAKAESEGYAVAGTAFTYAIGRLVLYSKNRDLVQGERTLQDAQFARLAIANPATAPYGAAAVDAMKALGVYERLMPKIVHGNNIAQTYQFVDTGNAELGFVALSQIMLEEGGSRWIVPNHLHAPIAQAAVLLKPGAENTAATAFLAFLRGPETRKIIEKFGYSVGE